VHGKKNVRKIKKKIFFLYIPRFVEPNFKKTFTVLVPLTFHKNVIREKTFFLKMDKVTRQNYNIQLQKIRLTELNNPVVRLLALIDQ